MYTMYMHPTGGCCTHCVHWSGYGPGVKPSTHLRLTPYSEMSGISSLLILVALSNVN